VEEGQVLAKLDDTTIISLQEAVAQVRINLRNAEENLEKAEEPYTELDVAQAEAAVVNTKVALEAAQKALDEAIERLEMATMVAPFAGIVTSVNIEAGKAVSANQVAIELADPERFEADILVSEIDIFNIRLGAEATIQVDAMSGISLPAEVTFI